MEITNILNLLYTVGFKVFGLNCMIVKNDCSYTNIAITQILDGIELTHPWNRKRRTYYALFRQHIIECPELFLFRIATKIHAKIDSPEYSR